MRRTRRTRFVAVASAFTCLIAAAISAGAAQLKEARVTQVVNDVKLLAQQAAPRPAAVNDPVRNGSAIRTGTQSRSELTFADLTITRLGANTIFTFNEGTREMNLIDGAILFRVPKGSGGATITTAAVTAGITGTTGIGEFHPAKTSNALPFSKWLCLEGTFHLYLPNGQSVELGPGKMVTTDGKSFSKVLSFDIGQLVKTSLFFTGFDKPLASLDLIALEEQKQLDLKLAGGFVDTTTVNFLNPTRIVDVISQADAAIAVPPAIPSEFGPLSVITSPVPYLITSGTTITTDPTITTNGVTDFGKIWRGQAQDGPLSAFIFGSTSAFDTASGFDAEINGQNSMGGAGFKFTSLELTGDPTIITTNGEINLGLIAVNGITSGGPGGTLTFAGIRGLLIATQDGSINLGPEISFSGLHDINFYARGSGSNLTLGSAISVAERIRLWAQGTIQINGDESATDFRAFSGGDFLAGTGTVTATDINIQSLSNVNIDASKFPDVAGGTIDLNAANTLNIALNPGGTLTRQSLIGQAATINLQFNSPNTFDLGTAVVSFIAGSGGIQASNVIFANGTSLLLQATGDINIHGTQNGAGDTIFAGGAFSAQSDVSTKTLQAGTSITIGGSVSARDFIEAGTAINVGGELSALSVIAGTNLTAGDITVLDTTGTTSDGNVDISATNQISITNGVDINRRFGGASSGLNVLLIAGTDLTAGNGLTILADNSVNGNLDNGANITLSTGGNLTINGGGGLSLTVDNSGGGQIGTGGNISVATDGDLVTTGGGAAFTVQNTTGTINNGANVTLVVGGSISSAQALNLLVENYDDTAHAAGHIGSGGNISVTTGGDLTAGSIDAFINNGNGGSIDSGGNLNFGIGGALTTQGYASFLISNGDGGGGGMIGSDALLSLSAASISVGSNLVAELSTSTGGSDHSSAVDINTPGDFMTHSDLDILIANFGRFVGGVFLHGGTIQTDAVINVSASNISSGSFNSFISNDGGGHIGGSATINVMASNAFNTLEADFEIKNSPNRSGTPAGTIGSDAMITVTANNISTSGLFLDATIDNSVGGMIGSDAMITVTANNISTGGGLDATINNAGGSIGGNATINMNVSGSATVTSDATFQILGNDPSGTAAINFNGGSYTVGSPGSGGMFLGSIDGNGAITFNNASVHADVIKAGVFGANGVLNIGGGVLNAGSLLKLYAPGSNGQLNFVSNVTLDGISTKILAANSITIFNNVVVTIGDDISASVYTNHPNYTGFGGNNSTTGTFGGVGANNPLPLSQAPPFGLTGTSRDGAASADGNAQTLPSASITSSDSPHVGSDRIRELRFPSEGEVSPAVPSRRRQNDGDRNITSAKTKDLAINVSSTDQLLSLLDGAVSSPGGKITIPASRRTSNLRNSSRADAAGSLKTDRGAVDIRTASSLPGARRLQPQ